VNDWRFHYLAILAWNILIYLLLLHGTAPTVVAWAGRTIVVIPPPDFFARLFWWGHLLCVFLLLVSRGVGASTHRKGGEGVV
jgi:hypothetical protein